MHFVLVHGAWHGAWCWEHLETELRARHIGVSVMDLPGHGEDSTPRDQVDMDAYVERVSLWVRELDRPVELVGHSMGGAIITAVAERIPSFLSGLTYLCAFIPRSGESLADLGGEDRDSGLAGAMHSGPEPNTVVVEPDTARDVFYHDCRSEDVQAAITRLVPQPVAPFAAPIHTTEEGFGSIPRAYILCRDDRAITAAMQQRMIQRLPCSPVIELATGHSPFYANPVALADALEQIGQSR
ncbi:MAG: alpha/beta fold hydrolase [Gammaproteobacteria bacterium]|nr:alpha/beta fold hydrolase [Gammaproteobacteria bacterium]